MAAVWLVRRYGWGDASAVATVTALPTMVIGLYLTLEARFAFPTGSAAASEPADLAGVADLLAVAVRRQWEAEAELRRLNDPYALPVRWQPANPGLVEDWASLVRLATTDGTGWPPPPPASAWAAGPAGLAGSAGELVDVLDRVPTGRLVGPRGAWRRQPDGQPARVDDIHSEWLLADQDCDLAWKAVRGSGYLLELRPVLHDAPPVDWGIRNPRFLLAEDGSYLYAGAPAARVTVEVLDAATHQTCPAPETTRRLKTWLGRRYDRPAIPDPFVSLARNLSDQIKAKRNRRHGERVRDILTTFEIADDGTPLCRLYAVIRAEDAATDPTLTGTVRNWISQMALAVPDDLDLVVDHQAVTDEQISLAFLEASFSLDVSTVIWPVNKPGPIGAVGGYEASAA